VIISRVNYRYKRWSNLRVRAWQVFWYRSLPYGLLSTRFLRRKLTHSQQLHRQLAKVAEPRIPRLIYWPLNGWIVCRWILFHAWRSSYRAVCRYGPAVVTSHDLSLLKQYRCVLILALAHTVPPLSFYQFRLYTEKRKFWDYIYPHELPAFHYRYDSKSSVDERLLLSDKIGFAAEMKALGVVVASGDLLPSGCTFKDLPIEAGQLLFCKPRIGNQSRGAFKLRCAQSGRINLSTISGFEIADNDACDFINKLMSEHDYIAQPYYHHHPDMRALEPANDEAITLRVITRNTKSLISVYCAYIEVPVRIEQKKYYFSVQVNIESGVLVPESLDLQLYPKTEAYRTIQSAASDLQVPHWADTLKMVQRAHTHFNSIYSIAWDLIITKVTPVLLEGNSNWRIDLPQQLCGGILADVP